METWLKCKVSPGQFSIEYAVQVEAFDGRRVSLFAPTDEVDTDKQPTGSSPVDGRIRVTVEAKKDDLLLVRLPRQTLENGQHVTVRSSQLDTRPSRQEA